MSKSTTRILILATALVLAFVCSSKSDSDVECSFKKNELSKDAKSKLYKGQTIFSLEFLEAVNQATPNDNIFFSPYSLYHVLLVLYFGSKTGTEEVLKDKLQLRWTDNKQDVAQAYKFEIQQRISRFGDNTMVKFSSVDKLFFGNHIPVSQCMADYFTNEIEELDFQTKPEESRLYINEWVQNNTNNEIKDILIPGSITENTKVAVANAAYFKGTWLSQFNPDETMKDIFFTTPNNKSFVEMMHVKGSFNHAANEKLGCHILELPYKTKDDEDDPSEMSMFILLPAVQTGLDDVLQRLTGDILSQVVNEGLSRIVDVKLPKFSIEKTLPLNAILGKMGLGDILNENADFSGFSDKEKVNFDEVVQKTKMVVNEEGSTAAAATVAFSFRSSRPAEPATFHCNHPFIFLIYDHPSKAVLFTGVYRHPE